MIALSWELGLLLGGGFIIIIIRRAQCPKRKKGRLFLIDKDWGKLKIKTGIANNRDKMASYYEVISWKGRS